MLGVLLGLAGILITLGTVRPVGEIPAALAGIVLGAVGYLLGVRKRGIAAVVSGVIAMVVGLIG